MSHKEFEANWRHFSELIDQLDHIQNDQVAKLIKRYIEQNINFFNEMLSASIENLKTLQNANSATDVICAQAKFAGEVNKKMTFFTKRFLDASLSDVADYNEWLKSHCDLATD